MQTKDQMIDTSRLELELQKFADARNWQRFHTPKNLLLAMVGEVGELVEIFQWLSDREAAEAAHAPQTKQAIHDELADVLIYLVRTASVLGVDLNAAVEAKLVKNGQKYPPVLQPSSKT